MGSDRALLSLLVSIDADIALPFLAISGIPKFTLGIVCLVSPSSTITQSSLSIIADLQGEQAVGECSLSIKPPQAAGCREPFTSRVRPLDV